MSGMTAKKRPTAFISHTGADKERFVRRFAVELCELYGVDAWVDEWEIKTGDNFTDKIFAAIDKTDSVVVILSENSVDSNWVKEEINAAFVRRVNEKVKLLPVVLDGLSDERIPSGLRHIHQTRVDAGDYAIAADIVNRAIRGLPNIGKPYLGSDAEGGISTAKLSRSDSSEFKLENLLRMASGDARAQNSLGLMYAKGEGVPQNYAEAVKWVRRAAEQGNAAAQFNLGLAHYMGQGVPQNDVEAAKLWRSAAEQGLAEAQNNFGMMCRNGKGVRQDDAKAVKWIRRAAEQGYAEAQSNLSVSYHAGQGVPQNDVEAVKWARRAAEQGVVQAQFNLGMAYIKGQGVPQDYVEAVKWVRRAAEQGDARAQFNLSMAYAKGQGVPQDDAKTTMWFYRAAEQGHAKAKDILNRIEKDEEEKK